MIPSILLRSLVHSKSCRSSAVVTRLQHSWNYEDNGSQGSRYPRHHAILAGVVGAGAGIALWLKYHLTAEAASSLLVADKEVAEYGAYKDGMPEYTLEDVAKHDTVDKRVWVAYRHGVYDITDFINEHPGGDKILMGAGGSVEPFWALYAVHKNPHVLKIFENYRIGNLAAQDVGAMVKDMSDPYGNEPRRHVTLKPASQKPFNAETPLAFLAENLITPNELFYVRNHLPVPEVDAKTYELEIVDETLDKEKMIKLSDIKKYPKHTITATIQCAGNRRSEMMKVKPVKGLSWGQAAIGNATWSGARLCDVLKDMGVTLENTTALHVQFEGLDTDPASMPYGSSIQIEKALDPQGDVILAYEMNGEPIPRDHGFPVRVVVPGVVGARNVKWLGKIVISEKESDAHWQQNDYKGFAPNIDWDTVDFTKSPAIQELPVISAICVPEEGETLKVVDGKVSLKGYAWSGGGRKIIRVDVSTDGGKSWQESDTLVSDTARHPRAWGWSLWEAEVPVSEGISETRLCVKAVDSQYNTQPENFENIWNLRGVINNAYHRVNVKLTR
ncbi:sulfite oxidase-like [Macrobrachium nipponense]|uniref:sulfite oxidase-like n=1 Tax=Macrobrachium nipponense TaxID=159736 RepID=UPI0030C88409